jgi:hypothetical protein
MRGADRLLRDRVSSARMPWMALAQAFGSQQAAFARAMQADRFCRVMGAARIKAAILPEKRADAKLIAAQKQKQQAFHLDRSRRDEDNNCCNSSRKRFFSCDDAAGSLRLLTGLDKRTMQSIAGSALCLNNSRMMRLIMLRVTARGARRFAATTPKRAVVKPLLRV